MPSSFPGSIDSFTNPLAASALNSPSHAGQHQDLNDAVNKVETYMGLVKVIPTAATNGTVGATGTVTIGSTVSSVTVTNAFSSLYDNYKILIQGGAATTSSGYLSLQLGSTTSNYRYDYVAGNLASTVSDTGSVGAANFPYVGFKSTTLMASIDLIGPYAAGMTMINCASGQTGNNMGMLVGVQIDATSFTSFTLTCSTGTMTGGTIRVYGYRN